MSQTEIDQQLQYKVYRGVAVSFVSLGLISFFYTYTDVGILSMILSGFLATLLLLNKKEAKSSTLLIVQSSLAAFIITASLITPVLSGITTAYWSYVVPLIVFFLFPVKTSLIIVGLYTLAFVIMNQSATLGPDKPQMLISYFFCLLLSCAFVFLREQRDKELKPLRKTDNLTLASTLEHLSTDLTREIQRSEREGSSLTVLGMGIDANSIPSPLQVRAADKEHLLRILGKVLHENLRPFDTYYRLHDDQFLIVLPHTETKQALKKADALRLMCKSKLNPHGENVTVSLGISGLNVGDDAQSLHQNALKALQQAQRKGANHTQLFIPSYRDDDPSTEMSAGQLETGNQ